MLAGGLIRFPDGRVSALRSIQDPEWIEQWLRRSVQAQKLWTLTAPLLPIGEGLTTSLGTTVPILGVDVDGSKVGVLFDLHTEHLVSQILGESLTLLHWLEGLDERQLEAFARYSWHDPNASLRGVWEKICGGQGKTVDFSGGAKVHILSCRPLSVLLEVQTFLQRQGLAIWFFWLHTLQGEQGEVVAIADLVVPSPPGFISSDVKHQVQQIGEAEVFLRSLQE